MKSTGKTAISRNITVTIGFRAAASTYRTDCGGGYLKVTGLIISVPIRLMIPCLYFPTNYLKPTKKKGTRIVKHYCMWRSAISRHASRTWTRRRTRTRSVRRLHDSANGKSEPSRLQTRHEYRTENKGKLDIGGGKFMAPEEVDAIATKRVQPLLKDINDKVEAERERRLVLKMEEEARREEAKKQKTREREMKELNKKIRNQEKQEKVKKQQEKQEGKARREAKSSKADEKQHSREGKANDPTSADPDHASEIEHGGDVGNTEQPKEGAGTGASGLESSDQANVESAAAGQRKSNTSTSPNSKVRGWIKNRVFRGRSFSEQGDKRRSFFGGAAMKESEPTNGSTASLDKRPLSVRDAAPATKPDEANQGAAETWHGSVAEKGATERDSHDVSPISSPSEEEKQVGDNADGLATATRDNERANIEPL